MARCSIQHMYTYTPSLREELQSPETKDNPPGGQSIRRDPGTRCRFPRTTKFQVQLYNTQEINLARSLVRARAVRTVLGHACVFSVDVAAVFT